MKKTFFLCLMACISWAAQAQDGEQTRAERIYEHLVAGRGDSIYVALNDEGQRQSTPALFGDLWKQLEAQFGKLESAGAWGRDEAQGLKLWYRDLKFPRCTLRLLIAFDADGRVNTLRVVPVPVLSGLPSVPFDKTRMEERDVAVKTDGFCLPGTLTLPRVEPG